jgi:hypothetical protein
MWYIVAVACVNFPVPYVTDLCFKIKNLFVGIIGPKDQGILYEHRERVWGDHSNLTHILDAVSRMKKD